MRVIPPLTITDAILTSSTCAEPHATETAYSTGSTYALGAEVISATTHRTYESLQAGNINHPLPVLPETSTDWWLDVGPSNRWGMFDLFRNTQTVQASPLTVVLTPGVRINSIALLGLDATSVTITMTSGGPTVYNRTVDLNTREVLDWYDYFFEPFSTLPSLVVFDLPPYTNGILTVAITNSAGTAKCGALCVGSFQYIGAAMHNAESDALNFSVVERDPFGNAVLVPRRSVPKTTQEVLCDKSRVNAVRDLRTALNAAPAVWSGLDTDDHGYFEALLILGYYRRFTIRLAQAEKTIISLELEEI